MPTDMTATISMPDIWDAMLTADMNKLYWQRLYARYRILDRYSKIFLAVMTSSSVASLPLFQNNQWIWGSLSAISIVFAATLPVLDWPKTIGELAKLYQKWNRIHMDYVLLVHKYRKGGEVSVIEDELFRIQQAELENTPEIDLPRDEKLLKKCFEDIRVTTDQGGKGNV